MRLLITLVLILTFSVSAFSSEIMNYVGESELFIYAPSFEELIVDTKIMIKRFYGRNYEQMLEQIGGDSKSLYGVNIFDLKALQSAGIDLKKPVGYIHVSNQTGYLLIPVTSRKSMDKFIKNNLGDAVPYAFYGNYLALSENNQLLGSLTNGSRLQDNDGFKLSVGRLSFDETKSFVWMESRYLSDISASAGVTSNMKIPYGFSAFMIDFQPQAIEVKNYSGMLSADQVRFMQSMRNVSSKEIYNIIDFGWGDPAVVGSIYLNLPMLFRYYYYIDQINILGIKGLLAELWQKYGINVERDLINNADGRLKLVVDKLDTTKNNNVLYGSIGIQNPAIAKTFVENVKSSITKTEGKLFSFDLFTTPFYHYQTSNYSLYYGVVENEFIFSTDKSSLTNLVRNIFDSQNGYLDKLPVFMKEADEQKKVGYSIKLDLQALFSNVKTGIQISKDFLVGVEDVTVSGNPDLDENPRGWNTTLRINFYK